MNYQLAECCINCEHAYADLQVNLFCSYGNAPIHGNYVCDDFDMVDDDAIDGGELWRGAI